jgi:hypothetical protein
MQSKLLPSSIGCAIYLTCLQVPSLRAISLKFLDAVQWLLPCSVRVYLVQEGAVSGLPRCVSLDLTPNLAALGSNFEVGTIL